MKTVQSYPHWKQIGFKNCTKNRDELEITDKLLSLEVIETGFTSGGSLRLNVDEFYQERIDICDT